MSYRIDEVQLKNIGVIDDFSCDRFSNINYYWRKWNRKNIFAKSIIFCSAFHGRI